MQYLIRSPQTELPRNPRKIPEYFEKQIFLLELGFIYGAPIWLNNAVCTPCRITTLAFLKPRFHSLPLRQIFTNPHSCAGFIILIPEKQQDIDPGKSYRKQRQRVSFHRNAFLFANIQNTKDNSQKTEELIHIFCEQRHGSKNRTLQKIEKSP